jgi:hypothetical protein
MKSLYDTNSDDEDESDDGDLGEYRYDGARRHWCCDGKARYFTERMKIIWEVMKMKTKIKIF